MVHLDKLNHNILGKGGFGLVEAAIWRNEQVALKTLQSRPNPDLKVFYLEDKESISVEARLRAEYKKIKPNALFHIGVIQNKFLRPYIAEYKENKFKIAEISNSVTNYKYGANPWYCLIEFFNKYNQVKVEREHEALKNEVLVLKGLEHKNIVKFHGVCIDVQPYRMVMSYAAGGSLKPTELAIEKVPMAINDIASGLSYLHGKGLVHLDLKPGNILINESGVLQLADFGLSKLLSNKSGAGTCGYMAPEVLRKDYTVRTANDIYSLGIILWQLCSQSKLPWSNWSEEEFSRKILEGYHPSLDRVKDYFHCIKDLIKSCLQNEYDKRPDISLVVQEIKKLPSVSLIQEEKKSDETSSKDDESLPTATYSTDDSEGVFNGK